MSMNIMIIGERECVVVKTGKTVQQHIFFDVIQTPTHVTNQILESSIPLATYKAYVMSVLGTVRVPMYAKDDIWEEGQVLSYEEYDEAAEHIDRLVRWIATSEAEGYDISFDKQ